MACGSDARGGGGEAKLAFRLLPIALVRNEHLRSSIKFVSISDGALAISPPGQSKTSAAESFMQFVWMLQYQVNCMANIYHLSMCLFNIAVDMFVELGCRGVHIHKTLGKMRTFKDYYYSNRRLQLQSDMAAPSRFLETYQPFCAQVSHMHGACDPMTSTQRSA